MKFLQKTYLQRARHEEARGNYEQAAAYYSKADELEKVGEMHEAMGDMAQSLSDKIREYQQALRWYKQKEHFEEAAEKLAKIMEVQIRADAKVSTVERHRLVNAAEYYALAKRWKKAGAIYEELGMFEDATEMYIQGGEVEQVERMAERKEAKDHRVSSAQQYYEEAEQTYRIGQRDRTYQALKQCLTVETAHTQALNLLERLEHGLQVADRKLIRLPVEEREYVLIGKSVMTVGRVEGNDLILTQPDVSRQHARLGFSRQKLLVEDLKSSNGTRLNGLRIQHRAEIRDHDVVCFGRTAQFEVRVRQTTSGTSAMLCPSGEQVIRRRHLFFSGDIHAGCAKECDFPLQFMPADAPSPLFKIQYQNPFWYFHPHPRATDVQINGIAVEQYLVIISGDTITSCGMTLLVE